MIQLHFPLNLSDAITEMNVLREEAGYSAQNLKQALHTEAVKAIIDTAKEEYASDMKASTRNQIERKLKDETDSLVNKAFSNYKIEANTIEKERQDALDNCVTTNRSEEEVNQEFDRRQEEAASKLQETLNSSISDFVKSASEEVVRTVETSKKEREKKGIEDSVKDHLRGFSRTIPSFLMAYGTEETTLENFDTIIPDEVFKEVTSISLAQFRFLRDGGAYTNEQTGEEEMFEGKMFDAVVFNDSVREFLNLKRKLADYFDEDSTEDIFDYIPPQKTNQIFTPKWVVKKMVDMLEQENPDCFDMPDKTFVDLYMKSGLYMTEIIKRLYQSNVLKEQFPEKEERLQHIFEKQVYGLAPTEIIYKIATNYILGFDESNGIGITGYIKDMEQEPNGDFYVDGWEKDYLQLKHYRYIRNQIAHENYAHESDMCSFKDTVWLDEFYQRIIGQTDPLALCYKKTRFHSSQKFTEAKKNSTVQYAPSPSKLSQQGNQLRLWSILLLIVINFAVLIFFFALMVITIEKESKANKQLYHEKSEKIYRKWGNI